MSDNTSTQSQTPRVFAFDGELACKYGLHEAIIIHHLQFWLAKNAANQRNIHDGEVWTYNSLDAWQALFPFWTRRQISRLLLNMHDKGLIEKGNYNKHKFDRTAWYTLKAPELRIDPNGKQHRTERSHADRQEVPPIPDSNQIVPKEEKRGRTRARAFLPPDLQEVTSYCRERGYTFDPEAFVAFYDSNGWMVGKNKMKDWKRACVTWQKREEKDNAKTHRNTRQTAADRNRMYHDTLNQFAREQYERLGGVQADGSGVREPVDITGEFTRGDEGKDDLLGI